MFFKDLTKKLPHSFAQQNILLTGKPTLLFFCKARYLLRQALRCSQDSCQQKTEDSTTVVHRLPTSSENIWDKGLDISTAYLSRHLSRYFRTSYCTDFPFLDAPIGPLLQLFFFANLQMHPSCSHSMESTSNMGIPLPHTGGTHQQDNSILSSTKLLPGKGGKENYPSEEDPALADNPPPVVDITPSNSSSSADHERMPKRKRRPSVPAGSSLQHNRKSQATTAENEAAVVVPKDTDVLFGRGDNINR